MALLLCLCATLEKYARIQESGRECVPKCCLAKIPSTAKIILFKRSYIVEGAKIILNVSI